MPDLTNIAPGWLSKLPDIHCVYQPVVDLGNHEVVGFEALARWPGTDHVNPDTAFAVARRDGLLDDLDRAAQRAAIRGARARGLPSTYTLFINVEVDTTAAVSLVDTLADGLPDPWTPRVIVELAERGLLVDPARVIDIVDIARSLGVGIALDDVGLNPESLTMLEFVAPDVIKIDSSLVRSRVLSRGQAATIDVLARYIESSPSTTLIAEGIETADDLEQARAFGATHGQGWLLGRPAALPMNLPTSGLSVGGFVTQRTPAFAGLKNPSEFLAGLPTRIARKRLLMGLTRHLEDAAANLHEPIVLLASFQEADNFTPEIAARFSALAEEQPHAFVGVLGIGMPAHPVAYVHGIDITVDEHLADDWIITVVSPHYCGALIARSVGDTCADMERRYTYALIHDRQIVIEAARSLMRRSHIRTPPDVSTVLPTIGTETKQRVNVTSPGDQPL